MTADHQAPTSATPARPSLAQARAHAETVECPRIRCHAPIGAPCLNPETNRPLRLPHLERTDWADHRAAERIPCPPDTGCGAEPFTTCRHPDGTALDPRHPDHAVRLKVAGVWVAPVEEHEIAGFPHQLNADTQRARGKAEVARRTVELEQRRRELISDQKAGQLTEVTRAEMVELDAILANTDGQPEPDERQPEGEVIWLRGGRPGGQQ